MKDVIKINKQLLPINILHIFNDGFQASLVLLLPFIAATLGLGLTEVGLLGTILNVASVALPAGYIATKIGGLKTLIIALLIYGAGFLAVGFTSQYYQLLGVFLIISVGFGIFHPIAFAQIAKWSPKKTRGRAIGNFTVIGDVGRIGLSAAISFLVVLIGWQHTAILYAIVAVLCGAGLYWFYISKRDTSAKIEEKPFVQLSFMQVLRNKRFALAVASGSLDSFASSSLYIFLPFLLLMRGVDPALLGTFTAAFFIGNLFGKAALGRFVDKFGNVRVFITAEILMALFILLLANSTAAWLIIVCSLILGMFTKGTVPVQQTMVSEAVEHHGNYEKAFGIGAFVTGIAVTIAPIILGAVSDGLGIVLAFNFMAIAALLSIAPALWFNKLKPKST